eukprot:CFRG2363T1
MPIPKEHIDPALDMHQLPPPKVHRLSPEQKLWVDRIAHAHSPRQQWRQALMVLKQQEVLGKIPSYGMYKVVMSMLADAGKWELALSLKASMNRNGYELDVSLYSKVITACGRAGRWEEAMEVFRECENNRTEPLFAEHHHTFGLQTYHRIMNACANSGSWEMAMYLLDDINDRQVGPPDVITYSIAIKALAYRGQWEMAERIDQQLRAAGLTPNWRTTYWLLRAYAEGKQRDKTIQLLNESINMISLMREREALDVDDQGRNLTVWEESSESIKLQQLYHAALRMCAVCGNEAKLASQLYSDMTVRHGLSPNMRTEVNMAEALCNGNDTAGALELLRKGKMKYSGGALQPIRQVILVGLINNNKLDEAFELVRESYVHHRYRIRDVTMYSRFILGYVRVGNTHTSDHWNKLKEVIGDIDAKSSVMLDSRDKRNVHNLDIRAFHALLISFYEQQRWQEARDALSEVAAHSASVEDLYFNRIVQYEHCRALWRWATDLLEHKLHQKSEIASDTE